MFSLNTGDTGFAMLSPVISIGVCMMTFALALLHGGMVRKKNVLTISDAELHFHGR